VNYVHKICLVKTVSLKITLFVAINHTNEDTLIYCSTCYAICIITNICVSTYYSYSH